MGSFLYKCSITQQTIIEGEKVIVVPIIQNLEYKESNLKIGRKRVKARTLNVNNIYPTDFWNHLGIYLEGEMGDYGRANIIESDHNKESLHKYFLELNYNPIRTEQGGNCFHDLEYNFKYIIERYPTVKKDLKREVKEYTWEEYKGLWDELEGLVSSNRVFCENNGYPVQLKNTIILDKVFNYVTKDFKKSEDYLKIKELIKNKKLYNNEILLLVKDHVRLDFLVDNSLFFNKIDKSKNIKELDKLLKFIFFQREMSNMGLVFQLNIYGGQDHENELGEEYLKLIKYVNKR